MSKGKLLLVAGAVVGMAVLGAEGQQRQQQRPGGVARPGGVVGAIDLGGVDVKALVRRDEAGNLLPVAGHLDIAALRANPLIDEAEWGKVRGRIAEWAADLDQIVIDNLDFVEAMDGGLLETVRLEDMNRVRYVTEMMMQLMGAGNLVASLQQEGLLGVQAATASNRMISEYHQAMVGPILLGEQPQDDAARAERADKISQFTYGLMARDALTAYRRLMLKTSAHAEGVVQKVGPSPEQLARVRAPIAALKTAGGDDERMDLMRSIFAELTFEQKRAALEAAREVHGGTTLADLLGERAAAAGSTRQDG